MKRHTTPTPSKGAQSVRTWLHVKHGNIFERMAMAEAFESPPPFIAPKLFLGTLPCQVWWGIQLRE